jgi:hypothetical protein
MNLDFIKNVKPNAVFAIALAANVMLQPSYPAAIIFVAFLSAISFQFFLRRLDKHEESANEIATMLYQINVNKESIGVLNSELGFARKDFADAHRVLDEAKKLLSQANLAAGFQPKQKRL